MGRAGTAGAQRDYQFLMEGKVQGRGDEKDRNVTYLFHGLHFEVLFGHLCYSLFVPPKLKFPSMFPLEGNWKTL